MDQLETSMPPADLLEILHRTTIVAARNGLDPADSNRLAAVSICRLRPEWPLHEALKFIWRFGGSAAPDLRSCPPHQA